MATPKLATTDDLVVCCGCGAQYDVDEQTGMDECRICEVSEVFFDSITRPPPTSRDQTSTVHLPSFHFRNVIFYFCYILC